MLAVFCDGAISADSDNKYAVAVANVDGSKVIYRYIADLPNGETQKRFPWLVVISWKYVPKDSGGMPNSDEYSSMNVLEDSLDVAINQKNIGTDVYVRTGASLREFAYYVRDRDEFTVSINQQLKDHSRYPISIEFFNDPEWSDFKMLLAKSSRG
jgi:hypothetical protein